MYKLNNFILDIYIYKKMDSSNISKVEQLEQAKSKAGFENLKSDYFLIKLFNFVKKNKSLEITKYSKSLQKRLHLTINNYIEYSQTYTPIELELTLAKYRYDYNTLINISDEDKNYYHIYFDDSNEEIKRNFLNENENVGKIKIIIDYQVKSFEKLFYNLRYVFHSIIFKKFYRNNITNMSCMFHECDSLKVLNLSNFNTNNVTDMNHMFYGCPNLYELDLSKFNTSKD